MSPKVILSLFVALIMGIATSPVHSGEIISCDSFETCPGGATSSAIITALEAQIAEKDTQIVGLDAQIDELEAEVIERTADLSGANLFLAILCNTIMPDGSVISSGC